MYLFISVNICIFIYPCSIFNACSISPDITLPVGLPNPCSVRHLVEQYFDIQGMPRRYLFELLSHFTSSELEKDKLNEFNSAEGQVVMFYQTI